MFDDLIAPGQERRHLPILVTGHPRSGTGFMAALSQAMGLDIRHEQIGVDGMSSCFMASPSWFTRFHGYIEHRGRNWFTYDRVFEVVRDPIACVASVAYTENCVESSLIERARWVPIDLRPSADTIVQAVQSIVGWHRMIRQWFPDAPVVRLESAATEFPKLLGRAVPADPGVINAREHEPLAWGEIRRACGSRLSEALQRHAAELGYECP